MMIQKFQSADVSGLLKWFIASLIVVAANCSMASDLSQSLPTDFQMKKTFIEKRSEFETLVQMSNENQNVIRISYDFTWVSDVGLSTDTGELGFTAERWNDYKTRFKKLNLQSGINRGHDGSVWFESFSGGLAVSGVSKGYVYSPSQRNCSAPSLDDLEPGTGSACLRLDGDWYLFLSR